MIHLDSSFLIDLLRETARERPGAAYELIELIDEHEALDQILSGVLVAYPDSRFGPAYGRLLAATTSRGKPQVSAFDLLIATAAALDDAPLVTRNVKDFSRIPGLRVLDY